MKQIKGMFLLYWNAGVLAAVLNTIFDIFQYRGLSFLSVLRLKGVHLLTILVTF